MAKRRRLGAVIPRYKCPTMPVSLRRVYLDAGGYSRDSGKYFGVGAPVYEVDSETHWGTFLRARDRADAKRQLRADCPGIKFKR